MSSGSPHDFHRVYGARPLDEALRPGDELVASLGFCKVRSERSGHVLDDDLVRVHLSVSPAGRPAIDLHAPKVDGLPELFGAGRSR